MHRIVEGYIRGERHLDLTELGNTAHKMADVLTRSAIDNRLTEVWGVEPVLVYQGLYAGQTDLIGVHDNILTVCDHKNANRPKKKEWLHNTYRLQLAAYAMAFDDMFGEHISRGINFIVTKDGPIKSLAGTDKSLSKPSMTGSRGWINITKRQNKGKCGKNQASGTL